ncbi:hypothetical protein Tco_1131678 [Tanacetum coccineum]|uniref:Uncharacterized protein n=1 Tax=Tanacetum coccineum TaxID=301880 RepID=A0ABQ5J9R0_9ASTR
MQFVAESGKCGGCNSNQDAVFLNTLKDGTLGQRSLRKSTCYLVERSSGNDLLTGSRGLISIQSLSRNNIHQHLNLVFNAKVHQLKQSCEMSKVKRSYYSRQKQFPSSKGRLNLLYMDLCGPMRVASIKMPEVLKRLSHNDSNEIFSSSYYVRTDRQEFLNKTLHAYFKEEGIEHQTSTPRTPEQKKACRED